MLFILTLILFTLGVIGAAAWSDFIKLRIPNILPLLVVGGFVIAFGIDALIQGGVFQSWGSHALAGGAVFMVMIILFFMNLFGGGDAKLIPAVSLWIGVTGLPVFLMVTTAIGGVLALSSITLRRTKAGQAILTKLLQYPKLTDGWVGAMAKGEAVIPYGIAIAGGAVTAFCSVGLLP